MRVLFSTGSFGFLRNFQSTVRLLAERGHRVHLLAERGDALDGQAMANALAAEYPGLVTVAMSPSARHSLWYALGSRLRSSLDYWRYLDERWTQAPKLRARAAAAAPAGARALPRIPWLGSGAGLAAVKAIVAGLDRALPAAVGVRAAISEFEPDILLLTPLLYIGSHQVMLVRAARESGVPSVVAIGSWDHLTTKGLLHEVPDRVLVWNEAQADEAEILHRVPRERITVTGAQAYDHWFEMGPSTTRTEYRDQHGLDADGATLLYLCSSPFIAPYEVGFVRRWITAIRASENPRVRKAGIVVRPHPQNATQWQDVVLGDEFRNVAVHPRNGANPVGGRTRSEYFDAMHHAEAVIGVNTSGMIESGIVGRPVLTVQDGEFRETQDGTLHFQHLTTMEGGLLSTAATLDEHVAQLGVVLADPVVARTRAQTFIQAFVRPHGLAAAATPRVVDAIEACASGHALPARRTGAGTHALRVVLAPLAVALTLGVTPAARRRSLLREWTRSVRLTWRRAIHASQSVSRIGVSASRQRTRAETLNQKTARELDKQRQKNVRRRQQRRNEWRNRIKAWATRLLPFQSGGEGQGR